MVNVVLLAAGHGSRFGGPKQFTPVTPDGSTLLELTIADARRAGCTRAVIVAAPGAEREVESLFTVRPQPGLEVVIAPQRMDDLPVPVNVDRKKPWGTAHAVWAAREHVNGPFLLFNADDYYGAGAPAALARALESSGNDRHFAMLGYALGATLSAEGTVARAVCELGPDDELQRLIEHTDVDSRGNSADGPLALDALVSMNAWGFTPIVFDLIGRALDRFVRAAHPGSAECFLPAVIQEAIQSNEIEVTVVATREPWSGMTWPGDRERVVRRLAGIDEAIEAFGLEREIGSISPHGQGLIHSTWKVGPRLVQRINGRVFADPVAVVRNADGAARRIDDALSRRGDEDPRHRIRYPKSASGRPDFTDARGHVWRAMDFIEDSRPADPGSALELRAAAEAFGRFPGLVASGDGPEPVAVLPGFHDTAARLEALERALEADEAGRRPTCEAECTRLLELNDLACRLDPGHLPTRFVHNDAKLDNVLVDSRTGEALCVIDLDTVMPGLCAHDFGDLVRSAVTGLAEDEPEPDRVALRINVFGSITEGYLHGARDWMTAGEQASLVDGAIAITFEQAVRFATDYLQGDRYFSVEDDGHNLRRTRVQLRLVERLLEGEEELRGIVRGCA